MIHKGEYLDEETGEMVVNLPVRLKDVRGLSKGAVSGFVMKRAALLLSKRREDSRDHKSRNRVYHPWEQ